MNALFVKDKLMDPTLQSIVDSVAHTPAAIVARSSPFQILRSMRQSAKRLEIAITVYKFSKKKILRSIKFLAVRNP